MSRKIYEEEFGWQWGVPGWIQEFVDAGVCEDTSWHNDVFPSFVFTLPDDTKKMLFVNHIVESERHDAPDAKRFMIYDGTLDDSEKPIADTPYMETETEYMMFMHVINFLELV